MGWSPRRRWRQVGGQSQLLELDPLSPELLLSLDEKLLPLS
ncbi:MULTISPECIES: hypothetical protein [Pseudomonas]|nr:MULTISPECIES: hypothetical protein [Pseudomonas]